MKNVIVILTLLLSIVTISCKKYTDGGNSFRIKHKLESKEWDLVYSDISDSITINKQEIMNWSNLYFSNDGELIINKEIKGSFSYSDKETLELSFNESLDIYTSSEEKTIYVTITKLNKTEFSLSFNISTEKNTIFYESH